MHIVDGTSTMGDPVHYVRNALIVLRVRVRDEAVVKAVLLRAIAAGR